MIFSDTSSAKTGILQRCEFLVFGETGYGRITGNANLKATFTNLCNDAVNRVAALILKADGRWEFDDINQTDLPSAKTSLVAEQADYTLESSHLEIERVEVKDQDGNWSKLVPIDQADVYDQSLTDFMKTSGTPKFYDKIGNSLFLYPKASYPQSASLKVYFKRPPSYFVVADTTKEPGFNSLYHRLVPLIASRDYAAVKNMKNAKSLGELVIQSEDDLTESYLLRSRDEHVRIAVRRGNFR